MAIFRQKRLFWGFFGGFWGFLGCFWGFLGCFWGVLGPKKGGPKGGSQWGVPGGVQKGHFWTPWDQLETSPPWRSSKPENFDKNHKNFTQNTKNLMKKHKIFIKNTKNLWKIIKFSPKKQKVSKKMQTFHQNPDKLMKRHKIYQKLAKRCKFTRKNPQMIKKSLKKSKKSRFWTLEPKKSRFACKTGLNSQITRASDKNSLIFLIFVGFFSIRR